jgi:hypothetical protein
VVSVANMTAPVPEDQDQPPLDAGHPPGEHASELPDAADAFPDHAAQEENAGTSLDEPSDGSGGE